MSSILAAIIHIAGPAFFLFTVLLIACKQLRFPLAFRVVFLLPAVWMVFIPVNGLPVVFYIRGFPGELSITTVVLILYASLCALLDKKIYNPKSFLYLMLLVLAVGLFLYPFSLGFTYFDPYALGYSSKSFLAIFFAVALTAWYFNFHFLVIVLALGISAFLAGVYESNNIWDYLIDPILTLFALFWIIIWMINRLVQHLWSRRKPDISGKEAKRMDEGGISIQEKN
jgi:hypothetical protein